MKNALVNRKSRYNPNRTNYLSKDGKTYCYQYWDEENKKCATEFLEIGVEGITEEWLTILDQLDHGEDLSERYLNEARDPLYEAKKAALEDPELSPEDYDDIANTLELRADKDCETENILFSEKKTVSSEILAIRRVVDEEFTEDQKMFYHLYFGMKMKIVDIRRLEEMRTGKLPSAPAMSKRKEKMLDKTAKALGIKREKRHIYPTKK